MKHVSNALKSVFIDRKNYTDPKHIIFRRFSRFLGDFRDLQKYVKSAKISKNP